MSLDIHETYYQYSKSFIDSYLLLNINNKKVIFAPIPKCANTSLTLFFTSLDDRKKKDKFIIKNKNFDIGKCDSLCSDITRFADDFYFYKSPIKNISSGDTFKFCFVRNPYFRALSNYFTFIIFSEGDIFERFLIHVFKILNKPLKDIKNKISFKEFVDYLISVEESKLNFHFKPQSLFLENVNFDFIGKVENIKNDTVKILNNLNINENKASELLRINSYPTASSQESEDFCFKNYKYNDIISYKKKYKVYPNKNKYFDEEIRNKIYNKYKIDFDKFSYNKELS